MLIKIDSGIITCCCCSFVVVAVVVVVVVFCFFAFFYFFKRVDSFFFSFMGQLVCFLSECLVVEVSEFFFPPQNVSLSNAKFLVQTL